MSALHAPAPVFFPGVLSVTAACLLWALPAAATLILAVPSRAGWVIVSDRLSHNEIVGFGEMGKVWALDKWSVASASGTTGFIQFSSTGRDLPKEKCLIRDLVLEYFKDHDAFSITDSHPFAEFVRAKAEAYLRSMDRTGLAPTGPEGGSLCLVYIYSVKPPATFRAIPFRIKYRTTGPSLELGVEHLVEETFGTDSEADIHFLGAAHLLLELRDGTDPRFAPLREHAFVRRYVRSQFRPASLDPCEALEVARFLMEQARLFTPLLFENPNIGRSLDEIEISFQEGVSMSVRSR